MKKLFGILLLVLFAASLFLALNNDLSISKTNDSHSYASIIPLPPPGGKGRGL